METAKTEPSALVVDDVATNCELAAVMLEACGFTVDTVSDGESGLKRMRAQRYDIVLLDISMPGINGEVVCKSIRDEDMRVGRLIAYTAHAFPSERKRIEAAGFDALLIKPISLNSLQGAIWPAGGARPALRP